MTRAAAGPCLLWSVPNGSSAGNVLRTGVLARVLNHVSDARVVLMSPLAADPAFTSEFAHPRVSFELLPPHVPAGLEARLLGIVQARYLETRTTETLRIKLAASHAGTALSHRRLKAIVGRMIAPHGGSGRWYDWADRLVSDPAIEKLFDRYRPTLVAVATPGLIFAEIPLLRTARRGGVPTMAVDLSWDNLTNKLFPIRRVDRLIVWNPTMRGEAHELHGYRLQDVDIAGPPQFDEYFNGALGGFQFESKLIQDIEQGRKRLNFGYLFAYAFRRVGG